MGLTDTVFGKPGTTTVHQTPATRDPGYGPARDFFNSLLGISKTPFPTYQGSIDPGLSPTMMDVIRRAQGYGQSGAPEILGGAQGVLGRYMNPSFLNPITRLFGGAPDYSGIDQSQRVFGGGPAGDQTFYGRGPSYMGGGGNMTSMDGGGYQAQPQGDPMQSMNGGGYQTPGYAPPFDPSMLLKGPRREDAIQSGGFKGGGALMREGGVTRPLGGGNPTMGFKPAPLPGGGMQFGRPSEPSQGDAGFGAGAATGPSYGIKTGAPNAFANSGRFSGGFNFPGKTPPYPGGGMQSMFKSSLSPGASYGTQPPAPPGMMDRMAATFSNSMGGGWGGAGGGAGNPRFPGIPTDPNWRTGGMEPSMATSPAPNPLGFGPSNPNNALPGFQTPSFFHQPSPPPGMAPSTTYQSPQTTPDLQDYQGTAGPGVQTAYDQGNVKNRGMVRQGANGPEILLGGGGGESVQWVPYDQNNWGHQQQSQMFNRYGSNWTAGSRYGGGHSTDIPNQFQLATGRQPTQQEQYDIYYGVNKLPPFPGAQG